MAANQVNPGQQNTLEDWHWSRLIGERAPFLVPFRGTPDVSAEWVFITPARAKAFLERNKNRKMRRSYAEFLTNAMRDGQFRVTHQGVAFTRAGDLIDGQHRLQAVIESATSQWMLVVCGLDNDIFDVIDCGTPRTLSERLKKDLSSTQIASTCLRVLVHRDKIASYEAELVIDAVQGAISELDALKVLRRRSRTASASILAAAALRIYQYRDSSALPAVVDAIRRLVDGDLISAPQVIVCFYKQIMEKSNTAGGGSQLDLFVRAWTAFDPTKMRNSKLLVRDQRSILEEAREVFHAATQGNFR
jgi:hypothetical protein